jgi:hypothetical protein
VRACSLTTKRLCEIWRAVAQAKNERETGHASGTKTRKKPLLTPRVLEHVGITRLTTKLMSTSYEENSKGTELMVIV